MAFEGASCPAERGSKIPESVSASGDNVHPGDALGLRTTRHPAAVMAWRHHAHKKRRRSESGVLVTVK